MRLSTNERMRYVKDNYNHNPAYRYAFTIRGQEFKYETKEEYDHWFERSLDIAKEQQRRMESGERIESQMDIEEALEDSGQEKQYEINFENGHLSSGDECTCSGCIESERNVENR